MDGRKPVANQDTALPEGAFVLRCGQNRKWRFFELLQPLLPLVETLGYEKDSLDHLHGKAVGLIWISGRPTFEECNGYPWALKGKKHHKITHVKFCKVPVSIDHKGQGQYAKLFAEKPKHKEIAKRVYDQVADNEWTALDMTPLDAAGCNVSTASVGDGASDPSSSSRARRRPPST